MAAYEKRTVCVLVKAYPQPSQRYEETVCVAAVTEDHRLLRLYPVRFRHLDTSRRFNRFDWIALDMVAVNDDPRPESRRVKEDTITVMKRAEQSSPEERAELWKPCVVSSLTALIEEQRSTGKSLGIVRPDAGSVKFRYEPISKAERDEQEAMQDMLLAQQSLLEDPLERLQQPEYVFRYHFTSDGRPHAMQIHDWEVQTTYQIYRRRYGAPQAALEKMVEYYERRAPGMNLHLIMGNMHKRPYQFIVIGVLRTTADLDHVDAQGDLAL